MASEFNSNNNDFHGRFLDSADVQIGSPKESGDSDELVGQVGGSGSVPVDCNACPKVAEAQGRFERSEDQLTACREQVALFEGERSQAEANAARLFQELVDVRTERDEMRLELQRAKETIASCGEARESLGRMSKEVVRVCKENLESDELILRWEHWSDELCVRYLQREPVEVTSVGKRVALARLLGSLTSEVGEWRAWAGGILAAHSVSTEGATAERLQVEIGEIMGGLVESYQEQLAEAETERDEVNAIAAGAEHACVCLQQIEQGHDEELKGIRQELQSVSRTSEEWRRSANAWQGWADGLCKQLKFCLIQESDLGDSLMRAQLSGYFSAVCLAEETSHEWRQSAFDWYDWGSALMLANGLDDHGETVGATEMRKRIGEYVPCLKQQLVRRSNWNSGADEWEEWARSILVERDRVPAGADCSGALGQDPILRLIEGLEGDLTASEEFGASESARADAAEEQCSHEKAARLYALDATARSLYRVVSVLQAAQSGPEDINSMTVRDLVSRLARKLVGIDAAVREISLLIALIHPETETCGIEAIFAAAPPDQEIPGPAPELRTEPSNPAPGLWDLDDETLAAMGQEETHPGLASVEEPDFEGTVIGLGPEVPLVELEDLLEADDEPEHQPKIHRRPAELKASNCASFQLNPLSVLDSRTDSDGPASQAGGQDYRTAEHCQALTWSTLTDLAPDGAKELGNEGKRVRRSHSSERRSFCHESVSEPNQAVICEGLEASCQNKAIQVESENAGSLFSADQAFRLTGECPTCFELWGNYCDCECQGKLSEGARCVWGWVEGCQETGQMSSHRCGCSPNTRLAELVRAALVCVGGVS